MEKCTIPYHKNRILKESLAKLSIENTDWDLHIAPVLFAYRTAK